MLASPLSVTTSWPAFWRNACIATVNAPPLLQGIITSSVSQSSESSVKKWNGSR